MTDLRIDPASAPLDERDLLWLSKAEASLAGGLALHRWLEQKTESQDIELDEDGLERAIQSNRHPYAFRLIPRSLRWPEDIGYGFFDHAVIGNLSIPVLGIVQQSFFDRYDLSPLRLVKANLPPGRADPLCLESIATFRRGLREFVLTYFLRAAGFKTHYHPFVGGEARPLEPYLRPFSIQPRDPDPSDRTQGRGFYYRQLYYKLRRSERVGKFRKADRRRAHLKSIRDGGPNAWVLIQQDWRKPEIRFSPAGVARPHLTLPLPDKRIGVLHSDYIVDDNTSRRDLTGQYGFGYSFLDTHHGPGPLQPGFQTIRFQLRSHGKILVRHSQVMTRPRNFTSWLLRTLLPRFAGAIRRGVHKGQQTRAPRPSSALGFDPVNLALELADKATAGLSQQVLGLSRTDIERSYTIGTAIRFMRSMDDTSWLWRTVPDWSRTDELPSWVEPGDLSFDELP